MKKHMLISATFLIIGFGAFAQDVTFSNIWFKKENVTNYVLSKDLNFIVHGNYSRPIHKKKLDDAKLLSDFINDYPANWITDYVSVEILAKCNGRTMQSVSKNIVLTTEQKYILKSVDLASNFDIKVKYKSKNSILNTIDVQEMIVTLTVIPETEAEYAGGEQKLISYINENVKNKIPVRITKQLNPAKVIFTVNEDGKIVDAKIVKTSGDSLIDQLMVEAINKMPKWNPAKNSKGINVKQDFKFGMESVGC